MKLDEYITDVRRRIDIVERNIGSTPTESISNWVSPTLTGGWTSGGGTYMTVQYARDTDGFIHVRGAASGGASGTVFTLPVGYRPQFNHIGLAATSGALSNWMVTSAGVVSVSFGPGATNARLGMDFFFPAKGQIGSDLGFRTGSMPNLAIASPTLFDSPKVRRHRNGMTSLTGMLEGGSNGVPGAPMFQLDESLFMERVSLLNTAGAVYAVNRFDAGAGSCIYRSGQVFLFFSLNGMIWPGPGTQGKWITPTLENGWINYGAEYTTPGFFKDKSGWVHLKGVIKNGATGVFTTLLTLPDGYRPPGTTFLRCMADSSGANISCPVTVGTGGQIAIQNGLTAGAWISLDGLHFHTST